MRVGVTALEVSESTLLDLLLEFGAHGLPLCMVPLNLRLRCKGSRTNTRQRKLKFAPKPLNRITLCGACGKHEFVFIAPRHRVTMRLLHAEPAFVDRPPQNRAQRKRVQVQPGTEPPGGPQQVHHLGMQTIGDIDGRMGQTPKPKAQ